MISFLVLWMACLSSPSFAQNSAPLTAPVAVKTVATPVGATAVAAKPTPAALFKIPKSNEGTGVDTPVTATAKASPTPFSIDLPIDANSMLGTIEFSNERLDAGLKPRVMILIDSSGSMGQILDKHKSKMFFAKKLFGTYLADQWREKADVGMVVYGSRRKQDCSDFYMPFPVGERNLSKIDTAIKKMEPKGMTPIASSLEMAIAQLKNYPGPKRIMIFTDGEETCGGDSCKILEKAIQEKVFDLEMFVTGIGLNEKSKDLDKLRCLGKTFGAPNSEKLQQALSDINNEIHKSDKLNGSESGPNLFVQAPETKVEVKLYSLENGEKKYVRSFVAERGIKVPPGEYMAEVMLDPMYTFKKFKIPPKKTVTLKVTGVGYVQVNYFNNLLDVEVLNKDKKVVQSFESDYFVPVKSGEYDIRIFAEPFFERTVHRFRVIPGKKHNIDIEDIGVVQLDFSSEVGIHVFDSNDKEIGTYPTNYPFVLRAGSYRFFINKGCNLQAITVRKEKTIQRLQCVKQ